MLLKQGSSGISSALKKQDLLSKDQVYWTFKKAKKKKERKKGGVHGVGGGCYPPAFNKIVTLKNIL